MLKVNVITVNYKTSDFINNLILLLKKEKVSINFVVADNSGDLKVDNFEEKENFKLTVKKNNEPYDNVLDSHRGGLDATLGEIRQDYDFTLFMDPDVIFTEDSIWKSLNYITSGELDCFGVGKFYQWHKNLPDTKLPYVWFTFIKTNYLENFNFKVDLLNKAKRVLMPKKAPKDSGDKIYNLIEKRGLKYELIKKYPKEIQEDNYTFKSFGTDDWKDDDLGIIISHYRAGSKERNLLTHGKDCAKKQREFIEKSRNFRFDQLRK